MNAPEGTIVNLVGRADTKLNVSITRGPSSLPVFNVQVTSGDGDADPSKIVISLSLDEAQAHSLFEGLVVSFERLDDETMEAGNTTLQ